jgi:mannose-6-phosphate isomerase-like protein (cupin superfamily)
MIIRANQAQTDATRGRTAYPIADQQTLLHHLSVYHTTPGVPFPPHKHERIEIWYIVEGEAIISLDGVEDTVRGGDVVVLPSWVEHGLRSETSARWVCLG